MILTFDQINQKRGKAIVVSHKVQQQLNTISEPRKWLSEIEKHHLQEEGEKQDQSPSPPPLGDLYPRREIKESILGEIRRVEDAEQIENSPLIWPQGHVLGMIKIGSHVWRKELESMDLCVE